MPRYEMTWNIKSVSTLTYLIHTYVLTLEHRMYLKSLAKIIKKKRYRQNISTRLNV